MRTPPANRADACRFICSVSSTRPANVCRWRDLPDLYSHYSSRGIVLVSYAQSWAQLAQAFGEHGAEELWSSSNVRVYAGGVSDTKFLRRLSELVGDYDETVWAHSTTD